MQRTASRGSLKRTLSRSAMLRTPSKKEIDAIIDDWAAEADPYTQLVRGNAAELPNEDGLRPKTRERGSSATRRGRKIKLKPLGSNDKLSAWDDDSEEESEEDLTNEQVGAMVRNNSARMLEMLEPEDRDQKARSNARASNSPLALRKKRAQSVDAISALQQTPEDTAETYFPSNVTPRTMSTPRRSMTPEQRKLLQDAFWSKKSFEASRTNKAVNRLRQQEFSRNLRKHRGKKIEDGLQVNEYALTSMQRRSERKKLVENYEKEKIDLSKPHITVSIVRVYTKEEHEALCDETAAKGGDPKTVLRAKPLRKAAFRVPDLSTAKDDDERNKMLVRIDEIRKIARDQGNAWQEQVKRQPNAGDCMISVDEFIEAGEHGDVHIAHLDKNEQNIEEASKKAQLHLRQAKTALRKRKEYLASRARARTGSTDSATGPLGRTQSCAILIGDYDSSLANADSAKLQKYRRMTPTPPPGRPSSPATPKSGASVPRSPSVTFSNSVELFDLGDFVDETVDDADYDDKDIPREYLNESAHVTVSKRDMMSMIRRSQSVPELPALPAIQRVKNT